VLVDGRALVLAFLRGGGRSGGGDGSWDDEHEEK
jgi:hypothetical protein